MSGLLSRKLKRLWTPKSGQIMELDRLHPNTRTIEFEGEDLLVLKQKH